MEQLIDGVGTCSGALVPAMALWAVACLYMNRSGSKCSATECVYFVSLLAISGVTVRTVMMNDGCWLIHTTSLCVMIVAGVMRKPVAEYEPIALGEVEESLA